MHRILIILSGAVLVALLCAEPLLAQSSADWPLYPLDGHNLDRGPGGYLSWVKIVFCLLVFLLWVKTTDWVNQDCQRVEMPYPVWNSAVFFSFFAGLFLFALTIPIFALGYVLFLFSYGAPLGVYIMQRNAKVEPHLRVLTADHIRFLLSRKGKLVGVKIAAEKKAAHEKGPPVTLAAMGGKNQQEDQAHLLAARQSGGYITTKELISEAVGRRSDKVMLDFAQQAIAVRYEIDGVWHEGEPRDRDHGDPMLAVLKILSALDPNQRRARHVGKFGFEMEEGKFTCTIKTQGTNDGEQVLLGLEGRQVPFQSLEDLGMRATIQEQLQELLGRDDGLLLFSAMPSGGLTTTMTVALRKTDRFMRDFVELLDKAHHEPEVDNIALVSYDSATGQTPESELPELLRAQPNVVVIRELPNGKTARLLCREASDDKLIITGIRAKEAAEAILRVLMLKVTPLELAPAITAVLNQRLVRKLCTTCKEAYVPAPDLLRKIGIPAGRVEALYRPPQSPERVCPDCAGIGYSGRTAIFELLVVNDTIRETLVEKPKLEPLRQASRQAGTRSLREEGTLLVARGVTSLPELMRVLKQ